MTNNKRKAASDEAENTNLDEKGKRPMTVADLVKVLQMYPPDARLVLQYPCSYENPVPDWANANSVQLIVNVGAVGTVRLRLDDDSGE